MTDYDNDPRYEFVEDNVYFDTQTNETVFVLDGEEAEALAALFGTDEISAEQSREIIEPYLDSLFDSDLNEL